MKNYMKFGEMEGRFMEKGNWWWWWWKSWFWKLNDDGFLGMTKFGVCKSWCCCCCWWWWWWWSSCRASSSSSLMELVLILEEAIKAHTFFLSPLLLLLLVLVVLAVLVEEFFSNSPLMASTCFSSHIFGWFMREREMISRLEERERGKNGLNWMKRKQEQKTLSL